MTLHGKTNHIVLGLDLRYEPNKSPMMIIIIDFDFLAWIIEESFLYTIICFVASRTLYLPSYGSKKSAMAVHDTEPLP